MAEVAVTYGEEGRQNSSSKVFFWVIPLKATVITLTVLGLSIFFCVWIIRRYVRRVIYLSGYTQAEMHATRAKKIHAKDFAGPLREGVLDLRKIARREDDESFIRSIVRFVRQYKLFFSGCLLIVCLGILFSLYLKDVLQNQKEYEIIVPEGTVHTTISSEEAMKQKADMAGKGVAR